LPFPFPLNTLFSASADRDLSDDIEVDKRRDTLSAEDSRGLKACELIWDVRVLVVLVRFVVRDVLEIGERSILARFLAFGFVIEKGRREALEARKRFRKPLRDVDDVTGEAVRAGALVVSNCLIGG
jgi:hypothetical protein